jgi:parallel beta-helix repeat protein
MKMRLLAIFCFALLSTNCSDSFFPTDLVEPNAQMEVVPSGTFAEIAPSCGDVITTNSILTADVTGCVSHGLQLGVDGITLDCDGHTISSVGGTYPGMDGILLFGIQNAAVKNCHIDGFHNGITLHFLGDKPADENEILDNTIEHYAGHGLMLYDGNNNLLKGNVVRSPTGLEAPTQNLIGIRLNRSTGNLLEQNTANENMYGIWLWQSDNNELTDNVAVGNLNSGIHVEFSHQTTIDGNTTGDGLDGILLDGSNENVITNNTAYGNGHHGVSLWANPSNDNRIEGNDLSANERSSLLISHNSQRNVVRNNLMNENGWAGFELRDASHNLVDGNTFKGNAERAITSFDTDPAWDAHHNTFSNNTIEGSRRGISLMDCSEESIVGNEISTDECIGAGINLYRCGNSDITDNVITKTGNHTHGIRLEMGSNDNTVARNTIHGSGIQGSYGVFVYGSDRNLLVENYLTETGTGGGCAEPWSFGICGQYRADDNNGVFLVDADDNTVRGNTISVDREDKDWAEGIRLGRSANFCEGEANNVLADNIVNAATGIYLRATPTNTQITGNTLTGFEKGTGIHFMPSSGSIVRDNTITGFNQGLLFREPSANNLLEHNNIYANQLGVWNWQTGDVDVRHNYWGTPCPPATLFEEATGTIQWFPQLTALFPPAMVAEDQNGDGYADVCGRCPETGSENVPTEYLAPQHLAYLNGDGFFKINVGSVEFPDIVSSSYSLVDTHGCTCEQILSWKPGVEASGEDRFGCTLGTMTTWIEQIGWARLREK